MEHASIITWFQADNGFLADEVVTEVSFRMEWSNPTWPEPSQLVPVGVRVVSAIIGNKDCDRELLVEIFGEDGVRRVEDSDDVAEQIATEFADVA